MSRGHFIRQIWPKEGRADESEQECADKRKRFSRRGFDHGHLRSELELGKSKIPTQIRGNTSYNGSSIYFIIQLPNGVH